MSFRISSLRAAEFQHLFDTPTDYLRVMGAKRMIATKKPGFPCRVSLQDAEVGEEVILVHYEHQTADTPFRASHAIFVRPMAREAELEMNEVPETLRSRVLSLRGFDSEGMMVAAELADGKVLEEAIEQLFLDEQVSYLQLHFAKPGCYAARVDRVV